MKVYFLTLAEFYKDNRTFIISDNGSATAHELMEWFSPFIWKNKLYVLDNNANIYRLNNKSKLRVCKLF